MGLSIAGHLILLVCGSLLARSLALRIPPAETVCFVNIVNSPLAGGRTRGKREVSATPGAFPVLARATDSQNIKNAVPFTPPSLSPVKKVAASIGQPSPAESVVASPLPLSAPSLPGGSPAGATKTASRGAGGNGFGSNCSRTGGAASGGGTGSSGAESGASRGGEGDGPPGEVGFGTASGISYAHQVKPVYPALARRFNQDGRVLLRLTVAESGALVKVDIMEDPGFGLAGAAVEAVRRSRFNPARREGRPFAAQALLPVRFTLSGGE